jgi:hypothetical protein
MTLCYFLWSCACHEPMFICFKLVFFMNLCYLLRTCNFHEPMHIALNMFAFFFLIIDDFLWGRVGYVLSHTIQRVALPCSILQGNSNIFIPMDEMPLKEHLAFWRWWSDTSYSLYTSHCHEPMTLNEYHHCMHLYALLHLW